MENVIAVFDDADRLLNINLYDFINEQYIYTNKFYVCHVTKVEFKEMLKQIKNGCLNERCLGTGINNIGYNRFRYMMAYSKINNRVLISDYNNPKTLGAYYIDESGIHFDINARQFPNDQIINRYFGGLRIYTTETFDDVIKHYSKNDKIDFIPNKPIDEIINIIIKNPEEFYTKIYKELSLEERDYLKSYIDNKTCENCSNVLCSGYNSLNEDKKFCDNWSNEELIGKEKLILKKNY